MRRNILLLLCGLSIFISFPCIADEEVAPVNEVSSNVTTINDKQRISDSNNKLEVVAITKDLFQILFFISMVIVAVLSYKQAKKTVFSPIKTEIFKYQLRDFENVIAHFQNKSEIELKDDLDMKGVIRVNSFDLLKSYLSVFKLANVNDDFFENERKLASGAIMSKEYFEENVAVIGAEEPVFPKKEEPSDPALKLAMWNDKNYGIILYTDKNFQAKYEIKRLQNSPLLPMKLKTLLKEYEELIDECLSSIGPALEEAGKQMPSKFPTKDSIENFSPDWLANIHIRKAPELEPKAVEILKFINLYLNVDRLIDETV